MPPEGASSWAAAGQAGQHFFCCWAGDTDPGRPPGAAPVADHCPAGWHLRGPGEERYNRVSGLSLRRGQESPAVTTALHSELRPLNGNGGCAGPTAIPARCPQGWPLTGTGARAGISTSDSSARGEGVRRWVPSAPWPHRPLCQLQALRARRTRASLWPPAQDLPAARPAALLWPCSCLCAWASCAGVAHQDAAVLSARTFQTSDLEGHEDP